MNAPSEAEIAAFIRTRGVTRCPTACAAPTQGSGNAADRAALRQRDEHSEALRQQRGPFGMRTVFDRGQALKAG
jgi:hypothetical protein